MANIDLKKIDTTDYVAGDLHLTKSSSGELNWTPAHQAPYELLADDISSKTNTKGLVSGEQLSELIPDIPELTQANIDDKDDVSGTVNPSKVSFGGGGGCDEVLKGWTRTTQIETNLFDGLDVANLDYNDIYIEFRNVRGDGGSGSTIEYYINLQFKNSGAVEFAAGNKSYEALVQLTSSGSSVSSDDMFSIFGASFDVANGYGRVELLSNQALGLAGWHSDTVAIAANVGVGGPVSKIEAIASFHNDAATGLPAELWLHGKDGSFAGTFTADYRVMKRNPTGL